MLHEKSWLQEVIMHVNAKQHYWKLVIDMNTCDFDLIAQMKLQFAGVLFRKR